MLSREFLIDRGYCCGHGCLMCPYEPKHTKDNTNMAKQLKHFADGFHEGRWEEDLEDKKDKCVVCTKETQHFQYEHIDARIGYIEGAGQLCLDCYDKIYNNNNNSIE